MSELGKAFLLGVAVFVVWLLAVFWAHGAIIVGGDIPPKRFDHPFAGALEIIELSENYAAMTDGPGLMGFTWGAQKRTCRIYINRAWLKYRRKIIRHERGHCNGWPGDHRR